MIALRLQTILKSAPFRVKALALSAVTTISTLPLSFPLQEGICFFRFPLSAFPTAFLAVSLLRGSSGNTDLPSSKSMPFMSALGIVCPPVELWLSNDSSTRRSFLLLAFWHSLFRIIRLIEPDDGSRNNLLSFSIALRPCSLIQYALDGWNPPCGFSF